MRANDITPKHRLLNFRNAVVVVEVAVVTAAAVHVVGSYVVMIDVIIIRKSKYFSIFHKMSFCGKIRANGIQVNR